MSQKRFFRRKGPLALALPLTVVGELLALVEDGGRAKAEPAPDACNGVVGRLVVLRRAVACLDQEVHGKPLVYLDNAATAQKPRAVIEATIETMQAQGLAAPPPAPPPAEQVMADKMVAAGRDGAKQLVLALWNRAFPKE